MLFTLQRFQVYLLGMNDVFLTRTPCKPHISFQLDTWNLCNWGGALHVSTYPTPLGLGVSIGFLAVKLGILEFPATKKKSREKTNTSPKWQFLSKDSSIYNYNSARCFDFQGKPNASFCHIFFGYGLNFLRKKKKNKTWGSGASLQSGWEHISEVGESLPDLLPSKVKFEPSQPSQFT